MKNLLLFITLLCALTLSTNLVSSANNAASAAKKERGLVTFNQPVTLMGVTLKGEYLFVHNDEAMERGEACTFVYKGFVEVRDKLVVSFHCTPAERAPVANFTVRRQPTLRGPNEITEYQFAGSTEAHMVPSSHDEHVTIATFD